LNFITIHGKSKYPGLYIWLRNGEKRPVKIPDGCLLIQAAKQLEYMTGGYFYAGFHEVIVSEGALEKAESAKQNEESTWRVSSTLFSGFNYKHTLAPLPEFENQVSDFILRVTQSNCYRRTLTSTHQFQSMNTLRKNSRLSTFLPKLQVYKLYSTKSSPL
jgi:isopenicillin N synthase-like dioxygenase